MQFFGVKNVKNANNVQEGKGEGKRLYITNREYNIIVYSRACEICIVPKFHCFTSKLLVQHNRVVPILALYSGREGGAADL